MRITFAFFGALIAAFGQAPCAVEVRATSDYSFAVANSGSPGRMQWFRNGAPIGVNPPAQLFLLHGDSSVATADGAQPLEVSGVTYEDGRWGNSLVVERGGVLSYARAGQLDVNEGSLEMWVAPRWDASNPIYSSRTLTLFQYRAQNGENMSISQSSDTGILYAGGTVRGQWESAYGGAGRTRLWQAGEWHHIVFTWSASASRMQFYVDGVLAADSNEHHYWPPAATADRFTLGVEAWRIAEVRIWDGALDTATVRANAQRFEQPRNHESWLALGSLKIGDVLSAKADCGASSVLAYNGIPLTDAWPPSTLLPPSATSLAFTVRTAQAASCGWSAGTPLDLAAMTPFDSGQGDTLHGATFNGLDASPSVVNNVFVRCSTDPNYVLALKYRALPSPNTPFPRKGNLWGSAGVAAKGLAHAARIDLYLGASFSPGEIRALRAINPNVLVLTSINVVENFNLPEDYYLHDIHGKRIEVWPGAYRLNLTKPYVADYQARFAYQAILDSGLMVDGCFFDNFFTSQSWLKADIYGNPVQIDADEDGVPDDPLKLDAAWKAGVYRELTTWRLLMPFALASGHLPRPPLTEFSTIFNGDSIGFLEPEAADGTVSFGSFWDAYHPWWTIGRAPAITMVEAAPPFQIGYGYGYAPFNTIPPATLEFARTFYPYVRFGLAFTLMNDGYFAYEFGDTWHGNDWWYDELDFKLGDALGPAQRVAPAGKAPQNLLVNGGFENPLAGSWQLNLSSGAAATAARDTSDAVEGAASAHIIISKSTGTDWHVSFEQQNRALVKGVSYDLEFSARALSPFRIAVNSQKGSPDWRNYGLGRQLSLTTEWKRYSVTFTANETVSDARVQFFVGAATGEVWIDDVRLSEHPPDIYRRDFTNGIVLLNGTRQPRTVTLEDGFARLTGDQAPRHQYILDDAGAEFTASPEWRAVQYDSGMWKAAGPYYHQWGSSCRRLDGNAGTAQWDLALREDGVYTIDAWWPAGPNASGFGTQAVYEIVAGGAVVASATFDQRSGGDQWHTIGNARLSAADKPFVRIRNAGSGGVIADALHVRSEARLNDGSPAAEVTLEPMDGIVLARVPRN